MTRSYASVVTSIWTDKDFCERSAGAQRTYFMLFSQPEISACGLLALTIRRWKLTLKQSERKSLSNWLTELVEHHFIAIDEETEETLVRSFIRWDRGYHNEKRLPVIKAAMKDVRSLEIRRMLANEARRLEIDVSGVFPQVNTLSDTPSEGLSDGVTDAISGFDRKINNPQPSTLNPSSASRGTRLAANWRPTPELIQWVKDECPKVDGRFETENFCDWWHSKPGKDAEKLDWDLTYKTWMRKAQSQAKATRPQRGVPTYIQGAPGQMRIEQ